MSSPAWRIGRICAAPYCSAPLRRFCFRLEGPDALPDAAARFARDAAAFGAITSTELTGREHRYWSLIKGATPTELCAGDRSS